MRTSFVQREREFKSFHISDGIFICIFILIWLRDLPGIAIHAPSEDIGRLWTGRKKRGLLSIVRHQCVCQERKAWHARNPASGKPPKDCLPIHPCCSEETAPLFTKVPSFCSYKFFKCILLGGEDTTIKCQISCQIHEVEIRGKIRVKYGFFKDKIEVLQSGVRIRNKAQKHWVTSLNPVGIILGPIFVFIMLNQFLPSQKHSLLISDHMKNKVIQKLNEKVEIPSCYGRFFFKHPGCQTSLTTKQCFQLLFLWGFLLLLWKIF